MNRFHSGRLADLIHGYNATDSTFSARANVGICRSTDNAYTNVKSRVFAGLVGKRGYVEAQSTGATAIMCNIDTSKHKKYRVFHTAPAGFGGRVGANAYDGDDVVIDPAVTPTALRSAYLSQTSPNFGGCWQTTADSVLHRDFGVSSAVQRVRLQFRGGTAALRLASFAIVALDAEVEADLAVWGDRQWGPCTGKMICAAVPTYGLVARGDDILNDAATSIADHILRAVTLSGRLAPAHPGNSVLVTQNQYVSNAGGVYWVKTPGNTGVGTPPTGTDPTVDIPDGAAVFRYERPLATLAV